MTDRKRMIREMREKYSFNSPEVFSAMLQIPREEFVPREFRDQAYDDGPLAIGYGQTISQPYTVAFMTDLLELGGPTSRGKKILEIGTGSGYQTAILSLLAKKVYTVEIIRQLADEARKRLKRLGYNNIEIKTAGKNVGWKEKAPFNAILVTAGMEQVPQELFDQLKENGVLVAPVGKGMDKEMTRFRRGSSGQAKFKKEKFGIFHFVPFIETAPI
jgi:protein-L-isoaspartate(D-aspartate) O-methyltransferase